MTIFKIQTLIALKPIMRFGKLSSPILCQLMLLEGSFQKACRQSDQRLSLACVLYCDD